MEQGHSSQATPAVERVLNALKKDYALIGKHHIKAWQAWLVIGLAAGITTGIVLVANRSGRFEKGRASGIVAPILAVTTNDASVQEKNEQEMRKLAIEILPPRLAAQVQNYSGPVFVQDSAAAASIPQVNNLICPEKRITAALNGQWNASIWGDRIAWHDLRNFFTTWWDIYSYDLKTSAERPIAQRPDTQWYSAISGNRIVYEDVKHTLLESDVHLYDLATNADRKITDAPGLHSSPRIDGDRIVWWDKRDGQQRDIYLYDLRTESEKRITATPESEGTPDIFGDYIVYTRNRGDKRDVYLYDLKNGAERRITPDNAEAYAVRISGDWVVYYDARNSPVWYEADLYAYNLATNQELRITREPKVSSTLNATFPGISGNRVVWQDRRDGFDAGMEVYMYDLAAKSEWRVTNNPAHQWMPAIFGNRIIWTDERDPIMIGDIYACDFLFPVTNPIPDIRANSSDGPITITPLSPLSVSVSLGPGSMTGANAEWWAAATIPSATGSGLETYWIEQGKGWVRSDAPRLGYSGPLVNVPPVTIVQYGATPQPTPAPGTGGFSVPNLNLGSPSAGGAGLPPGTYTFYFAVDTNVDGIPDQPGYVDSVVVTVKP